MSASVRDAAIGHVFEGKARKLTLARALALSGGPVETPGWPDKNLHTDLEVAKSTGLSEIVVSGTQWEGYLVGLLVDLFGIAWFGGGALDIKIPRSVKIDETLQPKARIEAREPGGARRLQIGVQIPVRPAGRAEGAARQGQRARPRELPRPPLEHVPRPGSQQRRVHGLAPSA